MDAVPQRLSEFHASRMAAQGDIDDLSIPAGFRREAGSLEQEHSMCRSENHPLTSPSEGTGSIAVTDIEINCSRAHKAMMLQCMDGAGECAGDQGPPHDPRRFCRALNSLAISVLHERNGDRRFGLPSVPPADSRSV